MWETWHLNILNKILHYSLWKKPYLWQYIRVLQNKIIAINIADSSFYIHIHYHRVLVLPYSLKKPDLIIQGEVIDYVQAWREKKPEVKLHLNGNAELAQKLQKLLKILKYEKKSTPSLGQPIIQFFYQNHEKILDILAQYAQYELRWFPSHELMQAETFQLDQLLIHIRHVEQILPST